MSHEFVAKVEEIHPALKILERIELRMQRRLTTPSGKAKEIVLPPLTRTAPMRIESRKKKLIDFILPQKEREYPRAPRRYQYSGAVTLERRDRYAKGMLCNISETGLFVSCQTPIFREFEKVVVTIRPESGGKKYRAIGTVIRFEAEGVLGYGIEFTV